MLRYKAHCEKRNGEGSDRGGDRDPTEADRHMQEGRIAAQQPPRRRRLAGRCNLRCLQDRHAKQGREQHGDKPGNHQRNAHHREDGKSIFAGGTGREANRQKACDGDQSAGQHGRGQRPICEGCRLILAITDRKAPDHGVNRRHRVIHQQRQRDDQGTKRNTLKVNPRQQHQREHNGECQGNGKRHHRTGPHTKRHETHRHDDQDCLP